MRVDTRDFVYTLYVSYTNAVTGETEWTMQIYSVDHNGDEHWFDTVGNVSAKDPFKSVVKYDAWS